MTSAFPLQWPTGRPRTKHPVRAKFNKKVPRPGKSYSDQQELTVADALGRLQREVDLLGARDYVLSTNLALRLDGLPRSGQGEPQDRAVALYFQLKGKPHCLPCDRYDRVADNIAAIAKHIEATRAIERYGVATISEMFTGFLALPAPGERRRPWREVMGFEGSMAPAKSLVEQRFRDLSKTRHPDTATGSKEAFDELCRARDDAILEGRS